MGVRACDAFRDLSDYVPWVSCACACGYFEYAYHHVCACTHILYIFICYVYNLERVYVTIETHTKRTYHALHNIHTSSRHALVLHM